MWNKSHVLVSLRNGKDQIILHYSKNKGEYVEIIS